MTEKRLDIIKYIEEIQKTYADNDVEKRNELESKQGKEPITYKDLDDTVAYIFKTMGSSQLTLETDLMISIDLINETLRNLVNILKDRGVLTEEDLETLNETTEKVMKNVEEFNHDK